MFKLRQQRINYLYIPLLLWIAVESFYKLCNMSQQKPALFLSHIFDIAILILLYLLFISILGSTFKGTLTASIVFFILVIANQVKIRYSANPIYIKDVLYLNSASTFGDILSDTIIPIILSLWKNILLYIVIASGTCTLARFFDSKFKSLKRRLITLFVTLGIIIFMLLPIPFVNDIFIKVFYEVTAEKNNNTTTNMRYYYQHGVFSGMYGQYLTSMLRKPDDYKREDAEWLLNKTVDIRDDDSFGTPNIIMVFSESFWDVDLQNNVEFNKPITKNYNELKSKGMYVDMISPVFGGISCNTEYEMLTGGSLTYYPECFIPYMNLYNHDAYKNAPSIISELNNNGYSTNIVSAWEKNLFNCYDVYNYFGVDNVFYKTDLQDVTKKGGRISDDYLADNIINAFENKDNDVPSFYMVLTAEAHMPYNESKFDDYDIEVTNSTLSDEETGIMKSYAQGIYDADKMLKKLYDYIQTLDEPTILIFYGDHLPFLQTSDGKNVYDNIDYFNTGNPTIDTYKRYNTGCLILDNYNVHYEKKEYMSPYLIMPYILYHMDITTSQYYKWLYTTIDDYPASNTFVSINSKGEIVPTGSLNDSISEQCSKTISQINWLMFVDKPSGN